MFVGSFLSLILLSGVWVAPLAAQENSYRGKTLRLVVGFSAGGGFDVYSRAISRHIGRHILADTKKSRLGIDPMSGEELQRTIARLFKTPAGVVAKLKEVLK